MLARIGGLSSALVGAIALLAGGIAALNASASPVMLPPPPPPESYPLSAVALSPDGSRLAVALPDREPNWRIVVWDAVEGTHLQTLEGHEEDVTVLAFSPDGAYLLSASHNQTAWLWDPAEGTHLQTLEGHEEDITDLAFSPDGAYLLSASQDQTARLWDATNFEPAHVLAGHASSIESVAFSDDGAYLVTGGADETARLWDVETGNHLITFPLSSVGAGSQPVYWVSVAFSPDGDHMLTADASGSIQLWDAHTAEEIRTFREGERRGRLPKDTVTFLANGDLVAVQERDASIRVWERGTGTLVEERRNEGESLSPGGFSPGGAYVATGVDDGEVWLTEVETGEIVLRAEEKGTGDVRGAAFSADAERMAVATQEGVVHLWDIATGDHIQVFDHHRFRVGVEISKHPALEEQ